MSVEAYGASAPWNEFGRIVPMSETAMPQVSVATPERDDACYTLGGQRLDSAPRKGFYIRHGRKYVAR